MSGTPLIVCLLTMLAAAALVPSSSIDAHRAEPGGSWKLPSEPDGKAVKKAAPNADKERRDCEVVAIAVDSGDRGGGCAAHETREEREIAVAARDKRIEGGAVGVGDVGRHDSLLTP